MENGNNCKGGGLYSWITAVMGWLICAAFCLFLTIKLEAYPNAYDTFFPAVLLILFCNILIFLFVSTRWGQQTKKLFGSVVRVCAGEAIILGGLYILGKYFIGS